MKRCERRALILESISQLYFGHMHVNMADWKEVLEHIRRYDEASDDSHESLLLLLEEIYLLLSSSPFPVPAAHRVAFLTWLRESMEGNGWPIPDSVSEELNRFRGQDLKDSDYIFKVYPAPGVTLLEENRDPIGHGTTGLISWQGAVLLSAWAGSAPALFRGRSVLELGSGLGLFGLALAASGAAGRVTLTDAHPAVINFLHLNAEINLGPTKNTSRLTKEELEAWLSNPPQIITDANVKGYSEVVKTSSSEEEESERSTSVCIRHLDWTEYREEDLPASELDLIVGSDLVYAEQLLPHLVRLLWDLLRRNPGSEAYIACTQRNGSSLQKFVDLVSASESGLRLEVVLKRAFSPAECIMVNHESLKPVVLYKIELE